MERSKMKDVTLTKEDNDLVILPGSWRNFSGEERKYNARGQRNFNIGFNRETAERLAAAGWNVKQRDPREEGDEPLYYLEVKVNFGGRPPKVVLITEFTTSRGETEKRQNRIDEDLISELDHAFIIEADIIIHPYEWDINGSQGVTAYLNTLYAEIETNDLERKYGRYDESIAPVNQDDTPPWD